MCYCLSTLRREKVGTVEPHTTMPTYCVTYACVSSGEDYLPEYVIVRLTFVAGSA